MLVVVTGLKSEAKILRGLGVACVSVGGKANTAPGKIESAIAQGATGLVSFGIAGALHPDLRTGDVVVANVVTSDAGEVWHSNVAWARTLLLQAQSVTPALSRGPSEGQTRADEWIPAQGRDDERGTCKIGAILGLDRLLSGPADKAAAFARSEAWAVDMESHHVARAAAAHGLPFIAIRAISDRSGETLPACLADFVDGEGRTRMSAVLAALIFGRVKLGELIAAGRVSRRAHQSLMGIKQAIASKFA